MMPAWVWWVVCSQLCMMVVAVACRRKSGFAYREPPSEDVDALRAELLALRSASLSVVHWNLLHEKMMTLYYMQVLRKPHRRKMSMMAKSGSF